MIVKQGSSDAEIVLALQQRYGIADLIRGVLSLMNTKFSEQMQEMVICFRMVKLSTASHLKRQLAAN